MMLVSGFCLSSALNNFEPYAAEKNGSIGWWPSVWGSRACYVVCYESDITYTFNYIAVHIITKLKPRERPFWRRDVKVKSGSFGLYIPQSRRLPPPPAVVAQPPLFVWGRGGIFFCLI